MGGLDPAKILVILVIALIVLGPEKLPRAARQLGAAWRELTKIRDRFEEEVRAAVPDLADLPRIPTSPARAVSGYLTGLVAGTSTSPGAPDGGIGDTGAVPAGDSTSAAKASYADAGAPDSGWQATDGTSMWTPLVGDGSPASRRPPSVPAMPAGGPMRAEAQLVLDDPSMN